MGETIRAICENKSVSIECKRPSFESVKNKYEWITRVGSKEFVEGHKEVIKQYEANIITEVEVNNRIKDLYIDMAGNRYKAVSDKLFNFFNADKKSRFNTCATRVSYAINHSKIPLKKEDNKDLPSNAWIINNLYYGISVDSVISILSIVWRKPSTYNQIIKQSILSGCSEDFYHTMTSKEQNKVFFKEIQSLKRKGIIAMRLQGNEIRHTTLWEIDNFVDTALGISPNYLDETQYVMQDLYFWDLK